MKGAQKWTDPKVTAVFQQWARSSRSTAKDYAGLTWQDTANLLVQKKAGMYFLGMFAGAAGDGAARTIDDLDFFPFPTLGTQFDAELGIDAPIDSWQMTAKSPNLAADKDAGKAFLEFWAKGSTQLIMFLGQAGQRPAGQRRRHQRLLGLPEEGGRDHRGRPARSPSSSTATPDPASPANGCRASCRSSWPTRPRTWPNYQTSIQDFWDGLPPLS